MTYSTDLRQRVLAFIETGQSVTEAARLFQLSRATIYRWLARPTLEPTPAKRRHRKLHDPDILEHVKRYPSMTLKDRARHFQVVPHAISRAFKRLGITRKKSSFVTESGRAIYEWHICSSSDAG